MGGDDARETRCQLRPHRHFPFTFIPKMEQLADDLRAAFLFVKLGWFKNWSIPFNKPVSATDLTPVLKDRVPEGAILGQEISKTGKRLHAFKNTAG